MSQVRELRFEAGLSIADLAKLAGVSRTTIEKAEDDVPIRGDLAGKICRVLSEYLGRTITYRDAGIHVS